MKTFLFQAFSIPSASMVPTLQINDRVLVNKLSYRLHDVHRGDLVVFDRPEGASSDVKHLIKRVIAVEGDTIESRGDTIFVNGEAGQGAVPEAPRRSGQPVQRHDDARREVFVMGDNRTNSTDSRVFGTDRRGHDRRPGLRPHLARRQTSASYERADRQSFGLPPAAATSVARRILRLRLPGVLRDRLHERLDVVAVDGVACRRASIFTTMRSNWQSQAKASSSNRWKSVVSPVFQSVWWRFTASMPAPATVAA